MPGGAIKEAITWRHLSENGGQLVHWLARPVAADFMDQNGGILAALVAPKNGLT